MFLFKTFSITVCVIISSLYCYVVHAEILKVETASAVSRAIQEHFSEGTIFLDVDDTLIAPQSKFFSLSSPYRHLIDDLKKDRAKYKNFDAILSNWRLSRKTVLVDPEWPSVITKLKKAKYKVFALTQMNGGKIGAIDSMEKWRFQELKEKNIYFTVNDFNLSTFFSFTPKAGVLNGIFMTGPHSKSELVDSYFKTTHEKNVVVVDDREEHLLSIQRVCTQRSIPYLGLHFQGLKRWDGKVNPAVAEYQKKMLLENARWLEDEEAERELQRLF